MAGRKHISTLDAGRRSLRHAGLRPQRQVILIVCEGHTEEAYFRAVKAFYQRSSAVNIKIARDRSDPVRVVEKGISDNKNGDFDRVFCVVDGDNPERTALARRRAGKRDGFDLIVSIPCFEVWLFFHFEASDAPFGDCAAVCARLKVKGRLPDYVKGIHQDFASITPRIDDAIRNAQWLVSRNLATPATDVHRVLMCIRPAP